MAGFATSIAHNIYPAEFAQISQNLLQQSNQAAQAFSHSNFRAHLKNRNSSVNAEFMKANEDRDASGQAWSFRAYKQGKKSPFLQGSELEKLAGEGSLLEEWA